MGKIVPPPVRPAPAAASKSFSVVVTMMLAGNPLCWPRLPLVNKLRNSALSASWFRCGQLRVSRRACSFEGAPFTHGAFCSGLHIPGAASLAHTASIVARSSGVTYPLSRDIPSTSCFPNVKPRRRARSSSV
ncbi:Uncharacterised protein [Mycobacterium tuberculosis]|uniref:Uncharacterized protein n=1 Tax=Mycobacterium tuberculosis TaxID=1773 RepID=A0A655CIV7_MYCTX|nr:Uncharacterised protein [Mycobacterium tuberculosis]CFS07289.1 Uncharacterised protein [Mycobacterium tuberculosis]CFS31073.1 Uncharacterised protein [Mycobacterium tuberculosis]CKT14587.1 Uncharacterised protein [Mycobacterium tuberculosis]CNL91315.1 Uncharacterised protein [Mycobacterium tuberculosis]